MSYLLKISVLHRKQKIKMRRTLSRWLLSHPSALADRIKLQILLAVTARAFGKRGKLILPYPREKALREYAAFTGACMETGEVSLKKLYIEAYKLGKLVRSLSGLETEEELHRLLFSLYRGIGIDMRGEVSSGLVVKSCYFSREYTPRQCAVMSAMDSGIVAGLFGRGRLYFECRITEGYPECRPCFKRKDSK